MSKRNRLTHVVPKSIPMTSSCLSVCTFVGRSGALGGIMRAFQRDLVNMDKSKTPHSIQKGNDVVFERDVQLAKHSERSLRNQL